MAVEPSPDFSFATAPCCIAAYDCPLLESGQRDAAAVFQFANQVPKNFLVGRRTWLGRRRLLRSGVINTPVLGMGWRRRGLLVLGRLL